MPHLPFWLVEAMMSPGFCLELPLHDHWSGTSGSLSMQGQCDVKSESGGCLVIMFLHLTFLPHAASASVGRLYFFQGLRELCDTVSCRIGCPARSCGRTPVILVKSMKNYSWCLRQPSPKTVTTLYHAPQSSLESGFRFRHARP
jgi:hypothetical protein